MKITSDKGINILVWMVIGNFWKLLFLLCIHRSQGNEYVFESVKNNFQGCDCEFITFNVSVVMIIYYEHFLFLNSEYQEWEIIPEQTTTKIMSLR